jgi:hypothetical protein
MPGLRRLLANQQEHRPCLLDVASSLSGYVTAANDHLLVFSILMNGDPFDLAAAQRAQNAIGAALARSRPSGRIAWTIPSGS